MTHAFHPQNPLHVQLKADIQPGGGLLTIDDDQTVDDTLRAVGFDVLETRDLSVQTGPSVPCYQPLEGSGLSPASCRSSKFGRWLTHKTLIGLEALRDAPKETVQVSDTLNLCAVAMVAAGRLGIFTPMYFIHARKRDLILWPRLSALSPNPTVLLQRVRHRTVAGRVPTPVIPAG